MNLASRLACLEADSAFSVMTRAQTLRESGREIIDMSIGQPDFDPDPTIIDATIKALRDGHHGYTPASGIPPLRQAIADDLRQRWDVNIDPSTILVCPGAKSAIFYLCQAIGEAGAEILYPDPGFLSYRGTIAFSGAKAIPLPHQAKNGFIFDMDDVRQRINDRTRMIILNSPSNPTGMLISEDHWRELADLLEDYPNVWLLSDEIYARMVYPESRHVSALSLDRLRSRTIFIDGCSKSWGMTGWRIGWAVMPPSITEAVLKIASNCHSCVHAATQYGAIAALHSNPDGIVKVMQRYTRRRDRIVDGLNQIKGITCLPPQGAFYAFARFQPPPKKDHADCQKIQSSLLEDAGIAAISGGSFGTYGRGHIRFSFACPEKRIDAMLKKLALWMENYPS